LVMLFPDKTGRVELIHYQPHLLKDTTSGIEVADLPTPEQRTGFNPVLYATKDKLWYEYEPHQLTIEERLAQLEQKVLALEVVSKGV